MKNINKAIYKQQLKIGQKVEKEHTKSPKKATKIAKDHLKEFPPQKNRKYYTKLLKMEKRLRKNK